MGCISTNLSVTVTENVSVLPCNEAKLADVEESSVFKLSISFLQSGK